MSKLPATNLKTGWAIIFGKEKYKGSPRNKFVGIYAGSPKVDTSPVKVRLWPTRREARAWLREQRADGGTWARANYWRHAKPVRVGISITELCGS